MRWITSGKYNYSLSYQVDRKCMHKMSYFFFFSFDHFHKHILNLLNNIYSNVSNTIDIKYHCYGYGHPRPLKLININIVQYQKSLLVKKVQENIHLKVCHLKIIVLLEMPSSLKTNFIYLYYFFKRLVSSFMFLSSMLFCFLI